MAFKSACVVCVCVACVCGAEEENRRERECVNVLSEA